MQSDDLGLVPVAWRHRGPKGGWITTEKKQPWSEQPLYDAAAIERLVAAPEKLREVLRQILRCEYDGHGLNDCIDNDGVPYQSAFLANCIAEAENLVSESARQALKDAP